MASKKAMEILTPLAGPKPKADAEVKKLRRKYKSVEGATCHTFWCDEMLWQVFRTYVSRNPGRTVRVTLEEALIEYLTKRDAFNPHKQDTK